MPDPTARQAKLAILLREALPARHDRLDDGDVAELVERMQLSQQDIDAMLRYLARDTARIRALQSCRGQVPARHHPGGAAAQAQTSPEEQ